MKCKKRYTPVETVKSETEEVPEESSEDEFEIISNHEEDQEAMIPNQEIQQEEAVERAIPAEAIRDEQIPPIQVGEEEGWKIYVTKSGERYHLNRRCDSFKGNRSYERKACEICKERTQRILTLDSYESRSQSESELTFMEENEDYHDAGWIRLRSLRRKGKKTNLQGLQR